MLHVRIARSPTGQIRDGAAVAADDDDSSVDGGWWWIHPCPPWCMYWRPVRVLVRRAAREQQSVRVVDWDG